jgi:glycosyltransferase involved in cell wall biosynthesis
VLTVHVDTARTWRGGQNQALLTVLGLRALGHRTVLVAHPHGELRRRASEGLDVIPLAPRNELDLAAAWRFARVLKDLAPAVVHAHDPHGVALAATALAYQRIDPTPRLVASRRVDFHMQTNAFSRWKYRQVSMFICASEAIRHIVISQGIPPQRVVTVHEGIDLEHVDAAPPLGLRETFWLPTNAPVVLSIGALVPHKGHRHLVQAAVEVARNVSDVRFVILGEGELRAELTRQIRDLGLEKRVVLAGFRPDVLSLLKTCDLFVMPSITEGLGTSLLDALACERPVVASDVGGIPEVIVDGETGLLVPPRDVDRLAESIVRLLEDRALAARLASAGRVRVERQFTVERMVESTLAVYETLLTNPSRLTNDPQTWITGPPHDHR